MKKRVQRRKRSDEKENEVQLEVIESEEINLNNREIKPEKKAEEIVQQDSSIKKPEKNYLKTLIILVIFLLIVDFVSLYIYYQPDLSGFFKSDNPESYIKPDNSKCSDGTPNDSCSKNKPFYCYEGQLLKKAANCGCPEGYEIDFQDCKEI